MKTLSAASAALFALVMTCGPAAWAADVLSRPAAANAVAAASPAVTTNDPAAADAAAEAMSSHFIAGNSGAVVGIIIGLVVIAGLLIWASHNAHTRQEYADTIRPNRSSPTKSL